MRDIRCLIVDDEPLAIDIVVTYLNQLDIHTVATANNAIEAFQQLQQDPVDLLFLDLLYGSNYQLQKSETATHFHVTLKIPLQ